MADVFESIAAEVIGTMILGAALAHEAKLANPEPWIFFPLIIHALDLVISSVGIMLTIPMSDKEDPLTTMKRAYGACMALAAVGFMATCRFLLYTEVAPLAWWNYTLCGWIGIGMSFCIIRSTQYYTVRDDRGQQRRAGVVSHESALTHIVFAPLAYLPRAQDYNYAPVKRIAAASQTGPGTNVIAGISVGLESTCFPTLIIAFALISAFTLGKTSGLPGNSAGVFGTAVATMGMLCTAVFVLSMNNFGPIADNAGGIVEMSAQPHEVRVITDRLDSVGNVTKAASKGYAVGGSALSCFVLFQAFLDEISSYSGVAFDVINIARVEVVCGGLLGMMMIFLFAGWSMQSVGATAQKVVWEVRRQFKSRPGIMDGTEKPDYETCVAIVTREALKEMVWPALLALLMPVAVGFGFKYFGALTGRPQLGVEVIAGFMMFGTLTGLLMATFMDNASGRHGD
jgi:Na+/H+-translocating membrane pyrophosphatase